MSAPGSTVCAEGSLQRLTDEVPPGSQIMQMVTPCEHCGHPGCYPGFRCIHCAVEIRLQALEERASQT